MGEICDIVALTGSHLLTFPERRAAIVLLGHHPGNEPYSVTLEVTSEALNILRSEVQKAEKYLSMA